MHPCKASKIFHALCFITFLSVCNSLTEELLSRSMESQQNVSSGLGNDSFYKEDKVAEDFANDFLETLYYEFEVLIFTPPIVNKFGINTDYCKERSVCDGPLEMIGRTCQCDSLCYVFNDCCENIADKYESPGKSLIKSQVECVPLKLQTRDKDIETHMVTKCSHEWNDSVTKDLCESKDADSDIFLEVLVSDNSSIVYRNMYCAYCNFVYIFKFWTVEQRCVNPYEKSTCDLFYEPPLNHSVTTNCRKNDFISNCSKEYHVVDNSTDMSIMCEIEPTNYVYTFRDNPDDEGYLFTKYKNEYCALCNHADEDLLLCHTDEDGSGEEGTSKPPIYSFRILVDYNALIGSEHTDTINCKNDQIYDPISQICRQIFCPKTTVGFKGRCIPEVFASMNEMNENEHNKTTDCAFIKLKPNEWVYVNGTLIYVPALNKRFNSSMFYKNGTDLFLCSGAFTDKPASRELFYSSAESYLSLCGLILSISALIFTLLVYCMFQELLNIPGKILTCLMTSLLLAQVLFLFTSHAASNAAACKALAVLVHYFYMASFSWMNVFAFDLLITFSRSLVSSRSDTKSKTFYFYNVYGWIVPFIIVSIALTLDELDINIPDGFKPGYGQDICWITSRNALILFFIGPLALSKLIDIVGFVCTSCFIARSRQQGSKARKNNKLCSFFLYIKLSVLMGLTWVFAFLAMFTNSMVVWYMFVAFNTSQGVFIALCFLCTRKVSKLVRNKFTRKLSTTSSTILTSIRKSN